MNKDLLETQWVEAREFLKEKWNRLTDDDIRQVNGRIDSLLDKLQQRYGFSREQAEEEIRRWNLQKTGERERSYYENKQPAKEERERTTVRREREEKSNALKWLLWLGIPLLLLLSYLSSNPTHETATAPARANQEFYINSQTPADTTLAQSIRQALLANGASFQDYRNIRISANNGVVTVNGSVANQDQKDRISTILNNLTGVKQVNNQIEVRP